jgi:hypothetical protein
MLNYSSTPEVRKVQPAPSKQLPLPQPSQWSQSILVKALGTIWFYKKSIFVSLQQHKFTLTQKAFKFLKTTPIQVKIPTALAQ